MYAPPGIAIVTAPTRLEGLRRRWGTLGQAKFLLRHAHAHEQARRSDAPSRLSRQASSATNRSMVRASAPRNQQLADFGEYQSEADVYLEVVNQLEDTLDFG